MCGIAGAWARNWSPVALDGAVRAMTGAIAHRGPDADGFWKEEAAGLALGHRRLAILDLSAAGGQPMLSPSGRYAVVYNGEIYNFGEVRAELEAAGRAPRWRGSSDTEVLLAAIEAYGLRGALERTIGMFAFALWDRETRTLSLARDRMGEKPLYYGFVGGAFLFASELKALRACPGFDPALDEAAISAFLLLSCVPGPASIYRGVRKLQPGCFLTIAEPRDAQPDEAVPYWSLEQVVSSTAEARQSRAAAAASADEDVDRLEALLSEVVRSQMASDVPLGAFLSGGIDSSVVTALMQRNADRRVRTFSIAFDDVRYDESGYARAVAEHLGTDHTDLLVTERDALDLAPRLADIYDEPFADSSQIPSILLARMAREHVTVALTGDGGDEVFGGYNRHVFGPRLWGLIERMPSPARSAAAAALGGSAGLARRLPKGLQQGALRSLGAPASALDRAELFARVLREASGIDDVHALLNQNAPPEVARALPTLARRIASAADLSPTERMMLLDSSQYLPDDVLVKVDRATMWSSLESRAPLLDARVVEFAWTLPVAAKVADGRGKLPLRRLFERHLPAPLLARPKQGFAVPLNDWLRGDLRDWAAALLDPKALRLPGPLAEIVAGLWRRHDCGGRDLGPQLWPFLMLQAWLEQHRPDPAGQATSGSAPADTPTLASASR